LLNELRKKKEQFIISSITELELFSLPDLSSMEIVKIHLFLQTLFVVPVDSVVAREAAKLRALYKLKTPDAIIAATAYLYGKKMISNDNVFKKIKEITLLQP
jgi:hypothetical protein